MATRQLQYEDIASDLDWRTSPPQIDLVLRANVKAL